MLIVKSTILVSMKFAPAYTRFALLSSKVSVDVAKLLVTEFCAMLLLLSAGKTLWVGPNELTKTRTRHPSCFEMVLIIHVKVNDLLQIQPFAITCCFYRSAYWPS